MKTWEAIKALEEGKKVRKRDWNKNWYVFMNEDGDYIDECDCVYGFDHKCEDWELCDDRYDVDKELKTLYLLLEEFYNCGINEYDEYLEMAIGKDEDYTDYMFKLLSQLKLMNKYYKLDKLSNTID
jgi:hypothetical protein